MSKRKPLTVEDVKAAVQHIKESFHDYEHAHGCEDDLYESVLREIVRLAKSITSPDLTLDAYAEAGLQAGKLAREALKTKRIKFTRHTA